MFKLPAFDNFSTCLGAWDFGYVLVLLKMEMDFYLFLLFALRTHFE